MNIPSVISVCCGTLGLLMALLARRISRAPGSGDLRWFTLVCVAVSGYAFGNLGSTLPAAPIVVEWMSRAQVACVALQLWAWVRFSNSFVEGDPGPAERATLAVLAALVPVALVPGAVFGAGAADRVLPPFGIQYRVPITTGTGTLYMALLVAGAAALEVRFLRAWRRGVPHAGMLSCVFVLLVAFGATDALASNGARLPLTLDWGFTASVLTVGWVLTSRFIDSARALEDLRRDLVDQVEARTRELSAALESLHQAEKLATIGQFASGVAHEVNNPAATVTSNLRFLADPAGAPAEEVREAVHDALAAMNRINTLVRELVDAGRLAELRGSGGALVGTDVGPAVERAVRFQQAKLPPAVLVEVAVPPDLAVRFRREALEQVVTILVDNAAEAIPAGRAGRVVVTAGPRGGTVLLTVTDDGAGMGPDVLRRAFDPFFTTKGPGEGAGLSLAVARGLVESAGGTVTLESAPGAGTTVRVALPEAARTSDTPALIPEPAALAGTARRRGEP